jgi:hypothetical protein
MAKWPSLSFAEWRDTCETLHRYAQIVGKVQLATTPRVCHFWNVALDVTARGLATSTMPYEGRTFQMELDFVAHALVTRSSDGGHRTLALRPRDVADFYAAVMADLAALDIRVPIWDRPVEVFSDVIPFSQDHLHRAYDAEQVERFWHVLSFTAEALGEFRARFLGKASPVGLYWGTFDLAAARYNGRRLPEPPSGVIESEAFSHELSECGFWPGDVRYEHAAFYAMHAPAPDGFDKATVRPSEAFWLPSMSCFVLPYDAVRSAASPRATLLDFWESAYEAGAKLAGWDRSALERP